MAYTLYQKTKHRLPVNLPGSRHYDPSRPPYIWVPSIVSSEETVPQERIGASGNPYTVQMVETIQLRTTREGKEWIQRDLQPTQFTFNRTQNDPHIPGGLAVEGLDHIGGEVLTIDDLENRRAEQEPPPTRSQRTLSGANAALAASLDAGPALELAMETPPAPTGSVQTGLPFPDDIDEEATAALLKSAPPKAVKPAK